MKNHLLLGIMALACTGAGATTLSVGDNALDGTTFAAEPQLGGTVVEDEDQGFTFTTTDGTLSGSVQNRVVLSTDGTYDFYWRIHDVSFVGTTSFDIQEFRIGQFGATVVGLNANYRTDGVGDVGPDRAHVFSSPQDNYVNFLFDTGLNAGQDSYFMFLDTNETSYGRTAIYDFGREGSTQISTPPQSTFGPPAVPEPAAWAMFIAGFGLTGVGMRYGRRSVAARFA